MNSIEAVIINWKRPQNVARIVEALKFQTMPCTITICDCHPESEFSLDDVTLKQTNRIYQWNSHNCGAYSRYVTVGGYDHEFTLFIDDDMLPGRRCVEHFIRNTRRLKEFGVLGQLGRIIDSDDIYRPRDIPRAENFVQTDFVIRGYFVRTENLHYVSQFRWQMNYFDEPLPEDDLLLCAAMNICGNLSCYLTPHEEDVETLLNKEELDSAHALSKRLDHRSNRTEFLRRARNAGWLPLHAK